MDDISIDFLQELGEYNSELASRMNASGADYVCEKIRAYAHERVKKNSDSMYEWQRMLTDISQSKKKINEFKGEIRKHVSAFGVSYEEYNQIMADMDEQKKKEHLIHFLKERMSEIHGILLASGNLDKQVRRLNSVEEMLTMRKDVYIDQKNIIEALSVILLDDAYATQVVHSLLDEKSKSSHAGSDNQLNQSIEVVFEESLKEILRVLLLIEQYQKRGLLEIRRLQECDRQIVYMLTAVALQKNKNI